MGEVKPEGDDQAPGGREPEGRGTREDLGEKHQEGACEENQDKLRARGTFTILSG